MDRDTDMEKVTDKDTDTYIDTDTDKNTYMDTNTDRGWNTFARFPYSAIVAIAH
jgi:hypothetical protein